MRKINVLVLIIFSNMSFGQQSKQNYNWLVGGFFPGPSFTNGTYLNFEDCQPNVFLDATGFQFEGQTAISDSQTGALLFYSNGLQVRNSLGELMSDGLPVGITNSQTQNLIVKKPGEGSLYYLFTPEAQAGTVTNLSIPGLNGFSYSVIDMSLNGGLGEIVSNANLLMPLGNCEMVTGVYHANGQDVWIIGHQYGNDAFFVFLLTNEGITEGPILSNVGPTILTFQAGNYANSNYDAIGELKASPNGEKLAFTTFFNGYTCLLDFDNETGLITNAIDLELGSAGYGTSFSQDNSKLYFSRVDATQGDISFLSGGWLVQFDISSNDATSIQESMVEIYSSETGFRSLKLGPDGKIYVARSTLVAAGLGSDYLGVINNPNESGLACNYVNDGIFIGENNGRWGLNNVIEDFFSCGEFFIGPDLNICLGDSAVLTAPPGQLSYLWNTGETTSAITVDQSGIYWVTATNINGFVSDTLVVNNFPPQNIFITGQNVICVDALTTLNASPGFTNYLWSNGAQTPEIIVGSGNYEVTAIDKFGCLSSSEFSVIASSPIASFIVSANPIYGAGTFFNLQNTSVSTPLPIISWIWNFGDGNTSDLENPSHSYAQEGLYQIQLTVTNSLGCKDTFIISFQVLGEIVIPNIVTPNGDGLNDFFIIQNLDRTSVSGLVVYNRWGSVVFESENYQNNWTPNDKVDSVYYYRLILASNETFTGFFHVLGN